MRRKDREVQDRQEIFDILRRCDTVRIGIQGRNIHWNAVQGWHV